MKHQHILLIDDDEDDQETFIEAVKEASEFAVCSAMDDATDALEHLNSLHLRPDMIFLDLNMPVMNGQQFLKVIKKNEALKDIPVIIFSTSSHRATIEETKKLGAEGFITKPGKFDELVELLHTFLN